MKFLKYILLVTLLLSTSITADVNIDSYLPVKGSFEAEVWYLGAEPEAEAINQKMALAMAENYDWALGYITELNLEPGEILPYHKNFGITEDEYKIFVSAIGNLKLIKTGDVIQLKNRHTGIFTVKK